MSKGLFKVPEPINERVRNYAPGTHERETLKQEIEKLRSQVLDIPMVIGGEEIRTDNLVPIYPPHERKHLLGHFHKGDASHVQMAIKAALERAGGFPAERIDDVRWSVARALGADAERVVFTAGGTEANNIALLGAARRAGPRRRRVVVSERLPGRTGTLRAEWLVRARPGASIGAPRRG